MRVIKYLVCGVIGAVCVHILAKESQKSQNKFNDHKEEVLKDKDVSKDIMEASILNDELTVANRRRAYEILSYIENKMNDASIARHFDECHERLYDLIKCFHAFKGEAANAYVGVAYKAYLEAKQKNEDSYHIKVTPDSSAEKSFINNVMPKCSGDLACRLGSIYGTTYNEYILYDKQDYINNKYEIDHIHDKEV